MEYKNMKFRMGVFQIKNTTTGKIFIGSNTDLVAAWNSQRFQLEAGLHSCAALQLDWKIYGAEDFIYEIIEEIEQEDDSQTDSAREIKALEELIMEELQPFGEKGYNKKRE